MPLNKPLGVLCLLSILLQTFQVLDARDDFEDRCKIQVRENGALLIEPAPDKNLTLRLMGDTAKLMLNDVDVVKNFKQRYNSIVPPSRTHMEPLSIDALKEVFRALRRDLNRLALRLTNLRNSTQRGGPNRRLLLRDLRRVQRVNRAMTALELNLGTDECKSDPCKNGGTCYDDYKDFTCVCAAGWQGKTCEDDVNECFDLFGTDVMGCINNVQCINTPGSYRCVCRNGFTGTHCRLQNNICLSNQSTELCGHGTCVSSNNPQGYVCICDQGWTWAGNSSTASAAACTQDIDECARDRNPCHNECINLPGSFRCGSCPPGYTGDGKYCRDIDECASSNGDCSQNPLVACINTEGSYRCGRCPAGWIGDGRNCEKAKSNLCNGENICHAKAICEYISSTVICSCPTGLYGHGYGPEGCTPDESRVPCAGHLCQNNGTCVPNGRGTSCFCQPGFTGPTCAQADECHPSPCHNGGSCKLLPDNKYKCLCATGYTGTNCDNLRHFCGTVLRGESGTLRYPPLGSNVYQPDERCAFIIRTSPGKVINLTFSDFDLQQSESSGCTADFLQLHDGSSLAARLIGRFCGNQLPLGNGSVVSTHEQLFLWFRSDNATEARGFNITWRSQDHVCGAELSLKLADFGIIRSPGYPGNSRPNLDCRWLLTAPYGNRIVLRFYDITLGGGSEVSNDTLIIHDTDRQLFVAGARQLGQPTTIHSSSNEIRIDFHTDTYRTDSMFQLHYEVVPGIPGCGGTYTEPKGYISGIMNAPACLYLIEQPNGTKIQMNFNKLNFLQSENCNLQKLEIFDGSNSNAPLIRRYCGQPDVLEPLYSSGNIVLLRYEYALHGLELSKSFDLTYTRSCSGVFEDIDGGFIETPNYPQPYYENLLCTFEIVGPVNTVVQLNIIDLSISETLTLMSQDESDSQISLDESKQNYLDVELSKDIKRRFYKSVASTDLVSPNNHARLTFHGVTNKQNRRGLRIEYSFRHSACGGVLVKKSMHIFKAVNTPFCQWILMSPGRKRLQITAHSYLWPLSLTVFDNSTSSEGTFLTAVVNDHGEYNLDETYDFEVLTITLKIIQNASMRRPLNVFSTFMLEYGPPVDNITCGGSSNARFGVVKSPNWPKSYDASQDCVWIVRAPMGHRIELVVQNFTLETTSDACIDDFLEIRNGDMALSPLIGRYCGNRIPARIPSFGNRLFLLFHSDSYIQDVGFYLTWQMTETGCGGKLNSHIGSIHSPHSMEGNIGAVACDWQISVAQGAKVSINLLQLDNNLCNGQLSLYDGQTTHSPLLPLHCNQPGSKLSLTSTTNKVLVRYDVGHDSPDNVNFVLDYTTDCHMILGNTQGAFESPNFPENYPPNMDCTWEIHAGGRSNRLQLIFSHLNVERASATSCDYDFLELKDMRGEQLISQRRLCHSDDPITSEGNRLIVQFTSDASTQSSGFRAEYKRIGCGEQRQGYNGRFESPNAPYSVDLDCEWYIIAAEGQQVRLLINELHIETSQRDCSEDVFTAAATHNPSSTLLSSCQVETATQTITSPANTMYVHFRSSNTRSRKYFKASYVFVPAICGGFVSSSSGVISTPNDDGEKNGGLECVWTVEVTESYGINIQFEHFNLTDTPNCREAFVELKIVKPDGEYFLEKACGTQKPLIRTVHGQRLSVRFKTNDSKYWGSFRMRYTRQCGGSLSTDRGYIKSRLDEDCSWLISAPEGARVSLNIYNLECTCSTVGNCTNGLRLFNGDDEVQLYEFCEEHQVNVIIPANNVNIVARNINLLAQYEMVDNSCGGNITSARGTLTSPNYPSTYPSNIECVWRLDVRAGNGLELKFQALDLPRSEKCNEDFVEVRSGMSGPLLGLYCDNKVPSEPLLASSQVWIKFRSLPENTGNGFQLQWNYVHDNELTKLSGIIDSPPTMAVRNDKQSYAWRLLMPREMVVMLYFREYNAGLLLFDGFDNTALAVSIHASPWEFTSSSNVLYLKTNNADFDQFHIEWRTINATEVSFNATVKNSDCNEVYTLAHYSRILLKSPGYPAGYAPNMNCEWTFKPADVTTHAYIELFDARLEPMSECQADSLRILSSSNMLDWHEDLRICNSTEGSFMPIKTVHGTPNLKVQFKTDETINGTGFASVIRTTCGSNMTDSVGTILDSHILRSPKNNLICVWHIEVRPGRHININIEYASSPANTSCEHYGLIYDGIDDQAPLLPNGKFCNQIGFDTKSYSTSTHHAYIKYSLRNSNANPLQNRWNLTYREYSSCDGEVRLTHLSSTLNISSPGYPFVPHPHTDCSWVVVAPPGETITARFVDRFAMNMYYCAKEYVELFDGSTTLSRRLLRTCRNPTTSFRSTGNVLLVHYQSDITEPRGGFRLNVSLSSCGGEYSDTMGIISSEHYPALGAYPKPAVCEYVIHLQRNMRVRLNFSDVHLPYDTAVEANATDRIEIVDLAEEDGLSPTYTIYGNDSTPSAFTFNSYKVVLRLITIKAVNSYRGFKVQYERVYNTCHREVEGTSGELSLHPREYSAVYTACRWVITVPKGQRVRLELTNLRSVAATRPTNTSRTNLLTRFPLVRLPQFSFFNDGPQYSKITDFNLPNYNGSGVFESTDNIMVARFALGTANLGITLTARYTSLQTSLCPPEIGKQSSGSLSVNSLAGLQSYCCMVNFIVKPSETLTFTVQEYLFHTNGGAAVTFSNQFRMPFKAMYMNVTNLPISIPETSGYITILQTETIKLNRFQASYKRHDCGGVLQLGEGITIEQPVILPAFDSDYGDLECVWRLRSSYSEAGSYALSGNISLNDSCDREYLAILSGPPGYAVTEARLCRGMTQLNATLLRKTETTVLYHVTAYRPRQSQFSLVASRSLGGTIININEKPKAPIQIDAKSYKNNMEIIWEFTVIRALAMQVEFVGRFFIEDSANCINDQLQILGYQDDLWQPLATLCGRELPNKVVVQAPRMRIIFRTNDAITGDGFTFIVSRTCDITLHVKQELQTLSSSRFQDDFPDQMCCNFEFTNNATSQQLIVRVRSSFSNHIFSERICRVPIFKAYKEVDGSEQLIGEYCPEFEVRGFRRLRLQYDSPMGRHFEIQYQLHSCGGNYSAPFDIRPPQGESADTYANNILCVWQVTAPPDHAILLRFKYFHMELSQNCQYDYMAIYKGIIQSTEQRVSLLCGNLTASMSSILVDSNQALIVVRSDGSSSYSGFFASVGFTSNCNERLQLNEESPQMSLVRHLNINGSDELLCYFQVSAPADYRLFMELKQLQLNDGNCSTCNFLEVFDSVAAYSSSMGKYYGLGPNVKKLVSSYEDMLLKINGNHAGQLSFELDLRMEHTFCGITEYEIGKNETIYLREPAESGSTHCSWQFKSDKELEIDFIWVKLQEVSQVSGKCVEYLHITGSYFSKFYCGQFNNSHLTMSKFSNHNVNVTFHRTGLDNSTGFHIAIRQRSPCNRNYTELSGSILYEDLGSSAANCTDEIRVPNGFSLTIYISFISFDDWQTKTKFLNITDLQTNRVIAHVNSTQYSSIAKFTSTNAARITSTEVLSLDMFYYATSNSFPSGCGGNISAFSGTLTNPPYESRNFSECTWLITIPPGGSLHFMFFDFDMGSETNCNLDNIKFFVQRPNGADTLIRTLCGQQDPQDFHVPSNRVRIVAKKSPNYDGRGFTFSYRTTIEDPTDLERLHKEFV